MNAIRTQLVKIGNSRGVRIPKPLIDQAGLGTEVEISVEDNQLVIRPTAHPRQDWEEQFRTMAEHHDDRMLDEQVATEWDASEWTW